ncbi:MAG: RluA family pseudouridine synthase [Erysipelotrichaceae bacterium]|nr:RluA family pseudouridine synthase [Erysipelotrichaceae bacterium]MDD6093602.1 RluA family pseudouridine synthase [bacterium]MDY3934698.1 RluA family pseudouridine synthase [Bacilli bacterium]
MMEIVVSDNERIRIDKYLINNTDMSRNKIQKLINDGKIRVNGGLVKASYLVNINDKIEIDEDTSEEINVEPEEMKLDIVYEDNYLLVVNKPSGMVVHPGNGNYHHTLVNGLMYYCNNNLSKVNGDIRPGIVHRIDADTSGLLLVAKNDMVHNDLAKQIQEKSVDRKYIALVQGVIKEDSATIDAPIGRSVNDRKKMCVTSENSKDAITHIKVLERYKTATLIECKLETGRTHQIRVHMNYINHPVVNDPVYGLKKQVDGYQSFGQMLHAKEIGFVHPITKKYMNFTVDPPKEFVEICEKYREM